MVIKKIMDLIGKRKFSTTTKITNNKVKENLTQLTKFF